MSIGTDVREFTSPARKLVGCFWNSRNRWKQKCQEAKRQNKRLKNQTRAVERSRDQWKELIDRIEQSMDEVRKQGYHRGLHRALRRRLLPARTAVAQRFVQQMLQFTADQVANAELRPGEHLPGSSEVLESLIGKGKRLEGQQSKGGFTRMVLGMAAAVVNPTAEYLQPAMENVGTKDVLDWAKQKLGTSLQSLRRQTLGRITAEQIEDKLQLTPATNF